MFLVLKILSSPCHDMLSARLVLSFYFFGLREFMKHLNKCLTRNLVPQASIQSVYKMTIYDSMKNASVITRYSSERFASIYDTLSPEKRGGTYNHIMHLLAHGTLKSTEIAE